MLDKLTIKKMIKFDTDVKNKGVSIIKLIRDYLSKRDEFNSYNMLIKRNNKVGFHPSMMNNSCPRQLAFNFLLERGLYDEKIIKTEKIVKNENDINKEFIFDVGHILHGLIQYSYLPEISKINNIKYSVENSVDYLYDKYLISGTDDIEIELQDKNIWIVDIKTANSNSFYKYKTVADIGSDYLVQSNLYMLGRRIPRFCFLFINKNTTEPQMTEFFLEYDKNIIKEPIKNAKKAKNFLFGKQNINILPECKNLSGRYKNCQFSSLCFLIKNKDDLLKYIKVKERNKLIKEIKE